MTSTSLELGRVVLTNSAEKLKLVAICTGLLQVPYYISTLNHAEALQAFNSGHVYTTRGIGCSIDIKVLSDSQPLDHATHHALLHKLGTHLLDHQIWPRLGLVPSLELNAVRSSSSNISIGIRHGQLQTTQKAGSKPTALQNTDLMPPRDVCQAQLDNIQLELDFFAIHESKQVEPDPNTSSESKTLATRPIGPAKQTPDHLKDLGNAVRDLEGAASKIGSASILVASELPVSNIRKGNPESQKELRDEVKLTSDAEGSQPVAKTKSFFFSKETRHILNTWLQAHSDMPYPSAVEKKELLNSTGLTRAQLNNWLSRNRKNLHDAVSSRDPDGDMLTSPMFGVVVPSQQDQDEMLFTLDNIGDDKVDLLSQSHQETSWISETSTNSTAISLSQSSQTITTEAPALDFSAIVNLLDAVLQICIGGYYPKIHLPPEVKLEKPVPEICLSKLFPNMFNPGYREIMAFNNRFLPRIAKLSANPLPEHLQSSALKEQMKLLDAMPVSPIPGFEMHPSINAIEHRTRVCETRIFVMMQKTLYDPAATRKVWRNVKNENASNRAQPDEDSDPGLLDIDQDHVGTREWDDLLARLTSDEEFSDLLFSEDCKDVDDDDLLDEAERERLETERQTEEMLFGYGGYRDDNCDDDQYLLSGGESDGDNMLI